MLEPLRAPLSSSPGSIGSAQHAHDARHQLTRALRIACHVYHSASCAITMVYEIQYLIPCSSTAVTALTLMCVNVKSFGFFTYVAPYGSRTRCMVIRLSMSTAARQPRTQVEGPRPRAADVHICCDGPYGGMNAALHVSSHRMHRAVQSHRHD